MIAHFVMKAAFSHKLNFVVETWCFEEFEEGELRWGELRRDDPDHSSTELCKDCLRNMRDV